VRVTARASLIDSAAVDVIETVVTLFGRPLLGSAVGIPIGWLTQRERHSRWFVSWTMGGYAAGVLLMWPNWHGMLAALAAVPLLALGTFLGLVISVWTLGNREDSYIRAWGVGGFLATQVGLWFAAAGATEGWG
jgi:hypothetical protein